MSLKNPHKKKQSANFGCFTFMILLYILTGIYFINLGIGALNESRASQNWPSVTGKVVSIDMVKEVRDRYDYYTPRITYQYILNDNRYTSQQVRISGDNTYSNEDSAREAVNMYALDSPVTVYYDPEEPQSALLEHETLGFGKLITGVIFTGTGIFFILAQRSLAPKTIKRTK